MTRQSILKAVPACCLSILVLVSCTDKKSEPEKEKADSVPQGVITYKVDYPGIDKETNNIYSILPKSVTLTFKGNKYRTEVGVRLVGFKTALISDTEEKNITTILDFNGQRMYSELTREEISDFLAEFPEITYSDSTWNVQRNNMTSLAQQAVLTNIERNIQLISTREIPISNPNWCTPFRDIEGVLLRYEIEYYGVLMSFDAISIDMDTTIEDKIFLPPANYEKVPYFVINKDLAGLFKEVTRD